jgi:hypothetical protein
LTATVRVDRRLAGKASVANIPVLIAPGPSGFPVNDALFRRETIRFAGLPDCDRR